MHGLGISVTMKIHKPTRKVHRLLIYISSLVLIAQIGAEKCSPPVQVGSSFSISHTGNTIADLRLDSLKWLIKHVESGRYVAYSFCYVTTSSSRSLNGFSATISSPTNAEYQTTSTIANVERYMDKASIKWSINIANQGEACNLEVYDYRSNPSCSVPSLENKGTSTAPNIQVIAVCNISDVFPEPSCEFSQTRYGQAKQPVPPSYVQGDAVPSGNGDSLTYSRRCTMTKPVIDLSPGLYTFEAFMYPSGVTNGRTYGKTASSFELDLSLVTPTCDQPRLTNSNDDVTVTCSITSVYLNFTCQFYTKKDSSKAALVGSIIDSTASCTNTPSVSCVHQCTLTTPISPLGYGTHRFKVTMTVDGSSQNVDSSLSTGITLSYPSPKIENCPTGVGVKDGYIKEGTQATCECTRLTPGNPPGVQWVTSSSSSNTEVGTWNEDAKINTLSLNYDPTDTSTVYHCQGVSSLGQGVTDLVDYTPKFAYGPGDISEFATPEVFSLCPPVNNISMTCYINTTTVNPKPIVVIKGLYENDNDRSLEPFSDDIQSGKYRFQFTFLPTSGGTITARCLATNAKFRDLRTEVSQVIEIREPPPLAPAVSIDSQPVIQNGQEVDVIDGITVTVRCDVEDGFLSVTLSCKGKQLNSQFESSGEQLTQTLTPNKTNNGDTCTCTAVHPSGCYDKSTQFTFNVLDNPRVTKYTVETGSEILVVKDATMTDNCNTSHQMEVDVGTLVTFSCEGEGTPRPNMAVRNQRSQSVLFTSDMIASGLYENKAVATKMMTCRDTGFYVCEASNGIGASISVPIVILVKCPPELSTPVIKHKFTLIKGEDLVIVVKILGHPAPVNFTLTKVSARTKRSVRGQVIDADRYKTSYLPSDELHGIVLLDIYIVTNSDEGQYQLDIQDGNGDGLQYPFFIQVNEENTVTSTSNIGAIVGGVVGGLAIIAVIIIVIIIFLYRRGKSGKGNESINNDSIDDTLSPPIHQETNFGHVKSDSSSNPRHTPSPYEVVDAPTRKAQYEEVDIITTTEYLGPDQSYGKERTTGGYENVVFKRGEEDADNAATEYANEIDDGQVGRSDQPENIYNNLVEEHYNTPGTPYGRVQMSTKKSNVGYTNVKLNA